ncbi:MAG: SDR family oxidoreductase [Alphaproteobacteria bacterium]|nr:SDR family oxidoreductase [Alphaproteobacteria bacterium]
MADKLLTGDTALVTGGGAGIGRGIALALAQDGAKVLFADIDAAKGAAVEDEARQAGLDATFMAADLATVAGARALWTAAAARLGRISILVHSASPRRVESDTVLTVSDATWEAMISVNLRAGFVLGQEAARHMKQHAIKGRILYLTSLHAEVPRNLPHYSAAKAGTTMVMKELARALGPDGIRVNAIAPGAVPGGGFSGMPGLVDLIPLGRVGTPDDIAQMAVAVLSERFGRYVSGATIVVDGGMDTISWIPRPQ